MQRFALRHTLQERPKYRLEAYWKRRLAGFSPPSIANLLSPQAERRPSEALLNTIENAKYVFPQHMMNAIEAPQNGTPNA
jgi:hypothetical protein